MKKKYYSCLNQNSSDMLNLTDFPKIPTHFAPAEDKKYGEKNPRTRGR